MVYKTFLNWFALPYQVQHSLTTREWKPMLLRLSMLRSFVHESLVTLALGYLYEWLTTIESADRKDLTSQWPLSPLHIDHNVTLISGLSTFISQWSWNSWVVSTKIPVTYLCLLEEIIHLLCECGQGTQSFNDKRVMECQAFESMNKSNSTRGILCFAPFLLAVLFFQLKFCIFYFIWKLKSQTYFSGVSCSCLM